MRLLEPLRWRWFAFRQRRWTDDRRWESRRRNDRTKADRVLTAEDRVVVDGVREAVEGLGLTQLVIFGSVARGTRRERSDLDVYFEAEHLLEPWNRADPNEQWHVFGTPAGALIAGLHDRQEFAFTVARDALVLEDDGSFRAALIAIAQQRLTPT